MSVVYRYVFLATTAVSLFILMSKDSLSYHVHAYLTKCGANCSQKNELNSSSTTGSLATKNKDSKGVDCVLPDVDPWDEEVFKFLNPRFDARADCDKNFEYLTKLENGHLVKLDPSYYCWGRCLHRVSANKTEPGPWVSTENESFKYDCDFVEAQCSLNSIGLFANYGMLHVQIVEKKPNETTQNLLYPEKTKSVEGKQHNVYIIMIDSIGNSHADRTLPQTVSYFEKSMKAVSFPYSNKNGLNSKPNAIPLFFGKFMEKVNKEMYNLPSIEANFLNSHCENYLDNETFLFGEFAQYGYKTLIGEDWVKDTVNFPDCKGFNKQPAHHYLRPWSDTFYWRTGPLKDTISLKNCFDFHTQPLEYLSKFFNSYQDEPKLSFLWLVGLAHENANNVFAGDKDIYHFLMQNRKQLDEAFVFLMSDHGSRGSGISSTKVGALDLKNPFLKISVPKELRQNTELMNTLRENSKKLHTHFDTRATLLDILKYQPSANFSDRSAFDLPGELGHSYLRKKTGERSCRTLPIPPEYCICQKEEEQLDVNSDFAEKLGSDSVFALNRRISKLGLDATCHRWTYDKVLLLRSMKEPNLVVYSAKIKTSAPIEALFLVTVSYSLNGTLILWESVDREDKYGSNGKCNEKYERICHCKPLRVT